MRVIGEQFDWKDIYAKKPTFIHSKSMICLRNWLSCLHVWGILALHIRNCAGDIKFEVFDWNGFVPSSTCLYFQFYVMFVFCAIHSEPFQNLESVHYLFQCKGPIFTATSTFLFTFQKPTLVQMNAMTSWIRKRTYLGTVGSAPRGTKPAHLSMP